MKLKKTAAYIFGSFCVVCLIGGVLMIVGNLPVKVTAGVIVICLSLCFGLLIPNPISLVSLLIGICMIIFPSWITGVIMIVTAVFCAVANVLIFKKILSKSNE